MKLEIENKYLVPILNFLPKVGVKNEKSRARSKLQRLISRKVEEYREDDKKIIHDFANLDDQGDPIIKDDSYDIPKAKLKECGKERTKLLNEVAIIEGGEYVNHFGILEEVLLNLDMELTGQDAEAYDILLDAFEAAKETKKGGKK